MATFAFRRDHGPTTRYRRRVEYTIAYQRGVIDISRSGNPMWSVQRPPVRHLLKDPQDDKTACSRPLGPGYTVEYACAVDNDDSVECAMCMNEVSKS